MSKQIHSETGKDKITFRLPTHLKQEFKTDVDNMSDVLEQFVRDYLKDGDVRGDELRPLEEPEDREEAISYRNLCRLQKSGSVRGSRAESALAQSLEYRDKNTVAPILWALERKGYVKIQTAPPPNPRGVYWVHVRPYSLEAVDDA